MKRLNTMLAVVGLLGATMLAPVSPAAASIDTTCSAGDFCLYGEDAYTGCAYTNPNSRTNNLWVAWANCPAQVANGADSARNKGISCHVYFTDWDNLGGGYRTMNRQAAGGWWTDANLGNNYWDGNVSGSSGTVIENDMQSYGFCAP